MKMLMYYNIINEDSITGLFNFSPYIAISLFALIILSQMNSASHLIRNLITLVIKVGVGMGVYLATKLYLIPHFYTEMNTSLPVATVISYLNIIFLVYFSFLGIMFLKRSLYTFRNWYYLIPILSIFASKIIELTRN